MYIQSEREKSFDMPCLFCLFCLLAYLYGPRTLRTLRTLRTFIKPETACKRETLAFVGTYSVTKTLHASFQKAEQTREDA